MPYEDFGPILKKIRSPFFDGTVVSGLNEMLLLNQRNDYNFTFNFCKERVVGISVVLYFRKNFYLINAVNSVIRNLVSAGIVEKLHKNYLNEEKRRARKREPSPETLKIDQILGCFQILAGGYLISSLFFAAEIIYSAAQRSKRIKRQRKSKLVV